MFCLLDNGFVVVADESQVSKTATGESTLQYLPLDAPAGASQAVIVDGHALVHTRQILPVNVEGQIVGGHVLTDQVKQVLDNLSALLQDSNSSLEKLVRVNIYALSPAATDIVRAELSRRLHDSVRPALTSVLTPLSHRDALVAVDAVAVAEDQGDRVASYRSKSIGGTEGCSDASVLPRGGVAYISGIPAEGGLTESAVEASIDKLWDLLEDLELTPEHIVHMKVFLRPASSAHEVLEKLKKFFPDRPIPPVSFVEWLAPPPVEIELVAALPPRPAKTVIEYYNPPEVRPMQIFSRACLVHTSRQIYIAGIFPIQPGGDQAQALNVFDQLQAILGHTGSDLLHMAKGTYYVTDDGSARGMDRARLWRYDRDRPPAASKCMVHGVGQTRRKMTLDMIAVEAGSY